MRITVALLVSFLVGADGDRARADQNDVQVCPKKQNSISDPVVPRAETANAIFRSIVQERQSSEEAAHLEITVVREANDPETWRVFQHGPNKVLDNGNEVVLTVSAGGGFEMKIDRCTGTVRDFRRQK